MKVNYLYPYVLIQIRFPSQATGGNNTKKLCVCNIVIK